MEFLLCEKNNYLKANLCVELSAQPKPKQRHRLQCKRARGPRPSRKLPDGIETLDRQVERVLGHLAQKPTDLERYIYLIGLADRNETLFYEVLMSDPARFLEIVYDPTIGEACLKFDQIFRRPRGMYLSITRKGHVKEVLRNWPVKDVRFICVTNAGRILGLGDLGANGMGIPIGKLQLYTAAAGVPPEGLLPMYLDAGTNNESYLQDPLYVGLRQRRPASEELYAFVDEFVEAVQEVFPNCCIHFEDWTGVDAVALLARYRNQVSCYNDDIQGTAGVTLARADQRAQDHKWPAQRSADSLSWRWFGRHRSSRPDCLRTWFKRASVQSWLGSRSGCSTARD